MNIGIVRIESEAKLPWRKPSERPEGIFREIILQRETSGVGRRWETAYPNIAQDDPLAWSQVLCWLYADELPLPDWLQK